jgi:hypothetical protein
MLTALSQYGRRKRRSAGRVVMSAAGFSAAYYFDPMSGEQRRQRLQAFVRRTGDTIDEVFSGDGPRPTSRSEHRAVGSVRLSSANGAAVR